MGEFPFVSPPEAVLAAAREASAAESARGAKGAKAAAKGGGGGGSGIEVPAQGRRLVVFVLGGLSYSELRAIHEAGRASGREVRSAEPLHTHTHASCSRSPCVPCPALRAPLEAAGSCVCGAGAHRVDGDALAAGVPPLSQGDEAARGAAHGPRLVAPDPKSYEARSWARRAARDARPTTRTRGSSRQVGGGGSWAGGRRMWVAAGAG